MSAQPTEGACCALEPRMTLLMHNTRKRFGGTVALDGVDLTVSAGEIHALLGENGAGKSTLMKILAGALRPDEGTMTLAGTSYAPRDPIDARNAGVAMIYQELTLAPHLSVAQNLVLGRERLFAAKDVTSALSALSLDVDPSMPVRMLGPGERQLVEIARALIGEAQVVVLDEPTSSLGKAEAERVFAAMRTLRDRGTAVIFISHHLDEVRTIAERFTTLRDGRTVAAGVLGDVTDERLIEQMAGRPVDQVFPRRDPSPGETILRVESLSGARLPLEASLELRRGEILGLAGLVGAGRTEFLRAIFGLDVVRSGAVTIGAWTRDRPPAHPSLRIRRGMGMLSEDRKQEGLALRLPLATNTMLSSLSSAATFGVLRQSLLAERTRAWFGRLSIKARDPWQSANELSGGNQQKIAIARLLERDVDVFLLDEPTRGIDVASKMQIYRLLADLAAKGKAILVASSVTSELLGICDRVAVMSRGRIVETRPAREWSEESVLVAASSIASSIASSATSSPKEVA
jgi:ribose transport system ATP-binding protein